MPTVGVFASIFDAQGRILCVRQGYGPKKWTTPGGRMEPHESPPEALLREVLEETGYRVTIGELIGVYSTPAKDDIVLSFTAHILGREPWRPTNEIAELAFFPRDALPRPMRQRTRARIADAFDKRTGLVRVFTAKHSPDAAAPGDNILTIRR